MRPTVVALVPAYNEAESIAATIEALLAQTRVPDRIVIIPNGCTDDTADIARRYPVTVMELPKLAHRKSEALNRAWNEYAKDADVVVGMDADTVLPPNAVADWVKELDADPTLAGSSSKFTMIQPGLLPRLQKHEFAAWTSTALRKGDTHVLAGTGCAFNGQALRDVAELNGADMKEEAWTRLASSGRRAAIRTGTGRRFETDGTGEHTVWRGPTHTGQFPTGWSCATSVTTRRASTSPTLSSAPSLTTTETPSSAAGTTSCPSLNAVGAAASSTTSTDTVIELAGDVTFGTRGYTSSDLMREDASSTGITTVSTCGNGGSRGEMNSTGRRASTEPGNVLNGPWSYASATEDFRLTLRIRQLGYRCQVSPTVRAYTDSMRNLKSLMAQRHKWSTGTVEDLLTFGVNRLTLRDWGQQLMGIFGAFLKLLWLVVIFGQWAYFGELNILWVWWLLPVLFIAVEVKRSLRVPHRDWKDVALAASFFPNEFFMWLRSAWFIRSWFTVIASKVTGRRGDVWQMQYKAEGV